MEKSLTFALELLENTVIPDTLTDILLTGSLKVSISLSLLMSKVKLSNIGGEMSSVKVTTLRARSEDTEVTGLGLVARSVTALESTEMKVVPLDVARVWKLFIAVISLSESCRTMVVIPSLLEEVADVSLRYSTSLSTPCPDCSTNPFTFKLDSSTGSLKYSVRFPDSRSKSKFRRTGLMPSSSNKLTARPGKPSESTALGLPDTSLIAPASTVM